MLTVLVFARPLLALDPLPWEFLRPCSTYPDVPRTGGTFRPGATLDTAAGLRWSTDGFANTVFTTSDNLAVTYRMDVFPEAEGFLKLSLRRDTSYWNTTGVGFARFLAPVLGDGWGHPVPKVGKGISSRNNTFIILAGIKMVEMCVGAYEGFEHVSGTSTFTLLRTGEENAGLTYDSGQEEYTYKFNGPAGGMQTTVFEQYATSNAYFAKSHVDDRGVTTTFTNTAGSEYKTTVMERSEGGIVSRVEIDYTMANGYRMNWAVLRRKPTTQESWDDETDNIRRAKFTYYDGTGADSGEGNSGELKFIEVQKPASGDRTPSDDADWETVEVTYFRYKSCGSGGTWARNLDVVIEPAWIARLVADAGITDGGADGLMDDLESYLDGKELTYVVMTGVTLKDYVSYSYSYANGEPSSAMTKHSQTVPGGGEGQTRNLTENVLRWVFNNGSLSGGGANLCNHKVRVDLVDSDNYLHKRTTYYLNGHGMVMFKMVEMPATPYDLDSRPTRFRPSVGRANTGISTAQARWSCTRKTPPSIGMRSTPPAAWRA